VIIVTLYQMAGCGTALKARLPSEILASSDAHWAPQGESCDD
jgi:hypothetical protein